MPGNGWRGPRSKKRKPFIEGTLEPVVVEEEAEDEEEVVEDAGVGGLLCGEEPTIEQVSASMAWRSNAPSILMSTQVACEEALDSLFPAAPLTMTKEAADMLRKTLFDDEKGFRCDARRRSLRARAPFSAGRRGIKRPKTY